MNSEIRINMIDKEVHRLFSMAMTIESIVDHINSQFLEEFNETEIKQIINGDWPQGK